MDSAGFYRAAIPEPWVIMGLRLRPFSLGHLILLHRVDSAFVRGGTPDFEDLALSVYLCAHTYEDGLDALSDPRVPGFMARWAKRLTAPTWRHRLPKWMPFAKAPKPLDMDGHCDNFRQYLSDAFAQPTFSFDPNKTRSISAPGPAVLHSTLLFGTGLSESEILNRPYALSVYDWLTRKNMEGHIEFIDQEEIDKSMEVAKALHNRIHGISIEPNGKESHADS